VRWAATELVRWRSNRIDRIANASCCVNIGFVDAQDEIVSGVVLHLRATRKPTRNAERSAKSGVSRTIPWTMSAD
jgi:hypothetical protein